eukprot:CAMPEP_0184326044 /NCGR_PEP_ID=MMETSP1049-20130417/142354_1 /TAXON_ID=77928 /ORGANISM="Proteomonas sulcata, Strain CCMP704" /LENGTH=122 /DNA_ID=CAMNT_0026648213 /DNA_START=112 /DNA_END=480 /DNA_ORIENTATION=-
MWIKRAEGGGKVGQGSGDMEQGVNSWTKTARPDMSLRGARLAALSHRDWECGLELSLNISRDRVEWVQEAKRAGYCNGGLLSGQQTLDRDAGVGDGALVAVDSHHGITAGLEPFFLKEGGVH